jgi:hypothetical protein
MVGSFLGFRLLKQQRGPGGDNFPGSVVELPHWRMVLMLLFSVVFVVISTVRLDPPPQ